jgi:exosome complex RNA-binding protein Rrp42 (RNase PH superfamily)
MQKSGLGGFTSEELDEAIKMAIEENKKIQKLLSKRRSKK